MKQRLRRSFLVATVACAAALAGSTSCSSSTTAPTAGGGADGGLGDGSSTADGSGGDATPDTSCTNAAFAGCTTFEDRTAESAARTIAFIDFAYTPKCLRIKAGQTVLFEGDFDRHPLVTSCGPTLAFDHRSGTTAASFVLPAAGRYGYYCLDHGNAAGEVMSGAVDVIP